MSAAGNGSLSGNTIGYMLAHEQFRIPELMELADHATAAGFDLVATSDHFQPWQANERHAGQAWVTLGALGQRTQRLWMGHDRHVPHPAVQPGHGGAGLCHIEYALPREDVPRSRIRRSAERTGGDRRMAPVARALGPTHRGGRHHPPALDRTALGAQGRAFHRRWAALRFTASADPAFAAANGPKAMQLAGEHGDGLITDPQTWKQHKGEWEKGARSAGKDPATMPVLVEAFVVVGGESEAQAAAKLWNFIPKAFKGYQNNPGSRPDRTSRSNGASAAQGLRGLDREFRPGCPRADDQEDF